MSTNLAPMAGASLEVMERELLLGCGGGNRQPELSYRIAPVEQPPQ